MRLAAPLAVLLLTAGPACAAPLKAAVFAGGCFWSMEKAFEGQPGVASAVAGYSGGAMAHPTYRRHPGHLEAVRVSYDPVRVSYAQLVDRFFRSIDPTDAGGQICDRGPSYRTAIFAATSEEQRTARQAKARVARLLGRPVATEVRAAARFWPAEAYHQDYARRNPAAYELYRRGCGRDRALRAVWAGR